MDLGNWIAILGVICSLGAEYLTIKHEDQKVDKILTTSQSNNSSSKNVIKKVLQAFTKNNNKSSQAIINSNQTMSKSNQLIANKLKTLQQLNQNSQRNLNQRKNELSVIFANLFHDYIGMYLPNILPVLQHASLSSDGYIRLYHLFGCFKIWKRYWSITDTKQLQKYLNNHDLLLSSMMATLNDKSSSETLKASEATFKTLMGDTTVMDNLIQTQNQWQKTDNDRCNVAETNGETQMTEALLKAKL